MGERTVPVSCNLDCGGGCPLLARIKDGKVVEIIDNPAKSRHMEGCIKGYQMHRVLYAEDRLRKPLIRVGPRGGGEFKEISWSEAFDYVAGELRRIKTEHGPQSILHLGGSGSTRGSLHNTNRLTKRFLALFGGYTERHSSYSVGAATFVTPYILGTYSAGIDSATLESAKLIILWGVNPSDLKLECGLESQLREAKRRGVDIIVIDPRRSLTAKTLASQWIQVYPGTDAVLMAGILHALIAKKLVKEWFIDKYSHGFDELRKYIFGETDGVPKTPAWAERICGVSSTQIEELAVHYGSMHPVALIPGASIQRTLGGEEAIRMAVALQTATGNLGTEGGSPGALAFGTLPRPKVGSIPIPANPAGASIPVYRWAEVILEGRAGGFPTDIKAIYNVGGNYITQGSDTKKAIRAFNRTEFNVCHDRFLTPTAKYCDVVLPATTFLERNDIVSPNSGNYLLFSNKVSEPIGGSRNDYDIFCGLAQRLGFLNEFSEGRGEDAWLRSFAAESNIGDYDEFRRVGVWFDGDQRRSGLAAFIKDPSGQPLATPSGRVQIHSEVYVRVGGTTIPQPYVPRIPEEYPLRLISPKSRFRVHSQNANIRWFNEREKHRLWINPEDAARRKISDGDSVRVDSSRGTLRISAYVTTDIMKGVVCIQEGVWPLIDAGDFDYAGSVNMLTSTEPTMPSQASRTHSVNVQVTKERARMGAFEEGPR